MRACATGPTRDSGARGSGRPGDLRPPPAGAHAGYTASRLSGGAAGILRRLRLTVEISTDACAQTVNRVWSRQLRQVPPGFNEVRRHMDITRPLASPPLSVECPHCAHVEDDDFELLDGDRRQALRCSACGREFHMAAMECRVCATEHVFSWTHRPPPDRFDHLLCETCQQPYQDHEAASRDLLA